MRFCKVSKNAESVENHVAFMFYNLPVKYWLEVSLQIVCVNEHDCIRVDFTGLWKYIKTVTGISLLSSVDSWRFLVSAGRAGKTGPPVSAKSEL